jgi:hypothetical protein
VIHVRRMVLLAALAALVPRLALAQEMDLTLARLGGEVPGSGTTPAYHLVGGPDYAWKRLMAQLGAAVAPPVLEPAHSVGPGHFYIGVESWVTNIDSGQDYWRLGTRGDDQSVTDGQNRFARDAYTWFRANVRKGLPYGFELGAQAGHAMFTTYWVWGASVKWSLFEGFETGIGYLPDIAVRAAVHTLTGDAEFNLTVPSLDLIISKPFVLGNTVELTPIVAGQLLWIMADSEVVDLGHGRNPDPDGHHVFPQVRALRTRLVGGLQLRYMALTLTGSFAFDVVRPGDLEEDLVTHFGPMGERFTDVDALPRQWTASVAVGFTY